MSSPPLRVCIVGAGPRGLSVLERLCANAAGADVVIHVVDPYPPGAGRVWRTDQSRHLLMNTVACQVTVFTDDTVEMTGPVVPGPSLYEWARLLPYLNPTRSEEWIQQEALALGPDAYATRALYGHYLRWVFGAVVKQAAAGTTVRAHLARAVELCDDGQGGRQRVLLDDGSAIDDVDAVVLAQGHLPHAATKHGLRLERFAADRGLHYVPPASPADVDLRSVEPDEPVLLHGLGLCFFDYLTLLTAGRGGVFEQHDGRLRYRISGREPRIYAGSRRGVPHHARGDNQKGAFERHVPRVLTPAAVRRLRARGPADGGIDFRREVWPLIAKETQTVYYATLLAADRCGCDVDRFRARYLAMPWGDPGEPALLREFGIPAEASWSWERLVDPTLGRRFADSDAFRDWAIEHLRADVDEARRGNRSSPLKAALDVLRDLRNEVRLIVDHGGLSGRSHRDDLDGWYTSVNAFLSIGPPARRIEESLALLEAGVLTLVGPHARVGIDAPASCFSLVSDVAPSTPVRARTLIEARTPAPDLSRVADPLLRRLIHTGRAAPYRIADRGGYYETAGLAVTTRPYQVLDARGVAHPRRFAFGVPTESVHWVTAAGIRPGVGSVTLADADAIARRVLRLRSCEPTPPRPVPLRGSSPRVEQVV